jgi:shikimate kinase
MISKLKRTPGIYLVGFMACGKSVVGEKLAEKLGWTFADIDADIESEQKTTISEIFDTRGEEEFRRLETEAIRGRVRLIQSGHAMVVALGGGAFDQPRNYDLVANNGISIWLDCPLPLIRLRVEGSTNRPLARDPAKFEVLYYARREGYARADYHIKVASDDASLAVEAVLMLPIF